MGHRAQLGWGLPKVHHLVLGGSTQSAVGDAVEVNLSCPLLYTASSASLLALPAHGETKQHLRAVGQVEKDIFRFDCSGALLFVPA